MFFYSILLPAYTKEMERDAYATEMEHIRDPCGSQFLLSKNAGEGRVRRRITGAQALAHAGAHAGAHARDASARTHTRERTSDPKNEFSTGFPQADLPCG